MFRSFISVFLLLAFATTNFAQSVSQAKTEPASPASGGSFVSLDGKFAIALPEKTHGLQRLSIPTPFGIAKGSAFVWQLKEGSFIVGHADASQPIDTPEVSKQLFDQLRESMKRLASDNTGALRPEKLFELDNHPALEQRVDLFTGSMIQRTYLVSSRIYQTLSVVKTDQRTYEPAAVKALDSFRILTDAEVASKRTEYAAKAEPSALPQEPVSNRAGNDANDRNLVGRVKTVLVERQELVGVTPVQTMTRNSFEQFNDKGNLVRRESYDYKGKLDAIIVYGYIEGNRVSKLSPVRREYDPPPAVSSVKTQGSFDSRYDTKYEFNYDDQKRLTELKWLSAKGDLKLRSVYKYDSKKVEMWNYSGTGVPTQHQILLIDEKGNEIEKSVFDPRDGAPGGKYKYTYEYDPKGNWTKRTTLKLVSGDKWEAQYVDVRTITYY